jgi:hypothetical protein
LLKREIKGKGHTKKKFPQIKEDVRLDTARAQCIFENVDPE